MHPRAQPKLDTHRTRKAAQGRKCARALALQRHSKESDATLEGGKTNDAPERAEQPVAETRDRPEQSTLGAPFLEWMSEAHSQDHSDQDKETSS